MARFTFLIVFGVLFFTTTSCEKCKRCEYTYDIVTIVQGVNGEEQVVNKITGVLSEADGLTAFGDECIKKDEEFTIEQYYQNKKDTTTLNNFDFTCSDF